MLKKVLGVILLLIVAIIIYMAIPYSPVKNEFEEKVNKIANENLSDNTKIDEKSFNNLPEALKNYFINNGYLNANNVGYIKLHFKDADFVLSSGKNIKIDYTVYDFAKSQDRVVLIDSKMYGIPFQGIDTYIDGKGGMKGIIAKHISLFNETGADMDLGALQTYLSECLMHPSLALQDKITYKELDKYSVEATIKCDGLEASGIFYFNDKYEMTEFKTKRYSSDKGSYENWTAKVSDYKVINNINMPTKFQAIWNYDDGDLIYFNSNNMEILCK